MGFLVKCHDLNPSINAHFAPIRMATDVMQAFCTDRAMVCYALEVWSKYLPAFMRAHPLAPSSFQIIVQLSVRNMKKFEESYEIQIYACRVLSCAANSPGARRYVLEVSGAAELLGRNLHRYSSSTNGGGAALYRQSNLALTSISALLPSDKERRIASTVVVL